MKEINLKKAMVAYEKTEYAYNMLKNAHNYAKLCQGGAWELRSAEDADAALNAWKECQKESDELISAALDKSLSDAQGKARERTILALDIVSDLNNIGKKLGISKKAMEGIEVSVDHHAQDFPRSYKYTAKSTQFSAIFKNGYWKITEIKREDTRRASQKVIVRHTEVSKAAILDRFTIWS